MSAATVLAMPTGLYDDCPRCDRGFLVDDGVPLLDDRGGTIALYCSASCVESAQEQATDDRPYQPRHTSVDAELRQSLDRCLLMLASGSHRDPEGTRLLSVEQTAELTSEVLEYEHRFLIAKYGNDFHTRTDAARAVLDLCQSGGCDQGQGVYEPFAGLRLCPDHLALATCGNDVDEPDRGDL